MPPKEDIEVSSNAPESINTDLDLWLKSLGFSRGNPFATAEADQERALLPEFYVNVDGYERIKGEKTIIVFAPRGGGKSALRIVLASHAAPTSPEATTLAIEYTDFDPLIAKHCSGQPPTIDDHIQRLLRAGVQALLSTFCGDPTFELPNVERVKDSQLRAARVNLVTAPARSRLSHLLRSYHPSLLSPEALYERCQMLNLAFAPAWPDFVKAVREHQLHELLAGSPLQANDIARLLADLNDYPHGSTDEEATPTEQLKIFVSLAQAMGLVFIQFLIDRVDENPATADAPQMQADILEPLLAHLLVLETPGVAFKFFLSREARDVLLARPTIRRDRLTDQAVTVAWDKSRLKHLLNERLNVYSSGQVAELTQLCQETRVEVSQKQAPYLLGEWLEEEILQVAQHSPRRLLVALQLLCQAHLRRLGPTGLLEKADWEAAKTELMQRMPPIKKPPILRLWRTERIAWIGDQKVKLSPLEHKILMALVNNQGQCDRYKLANEAWGNRKRVASEAAIDQAIRRLRDTLKDDPVNPIYLMTERGEGFKLLNYEVE